MTAVEFEDLILAAFAAAPIALIAFAVLYLISFVAADIIGVAE